MHWHTDSCNFEWNFTRKTGSMSRKGNCWDNAVAESFFKTIKIESVYNETYQNHDHAKLSLFKWIETWYNRKRRHSALGLKQ